MDQNNPNLRMGNHLLGQKNDGDRQYLTKDGVNTKPSPLHFLSDRSHYHIYSTEPPFGSSSPELRSGRDTEVVQRDKQLLRYLSQNRLLSDELQKMYSSKASEAVHQHLSSDQNPNNPQLLSTIMQQRNQQFQKKQQQSSMEYSRLLEERQKLIDEEKKLEDRHRNMILTKAGVLPKYAPVLAQPRDIQQFTTDISLLHEQDKVRTIRNNLYQRLEKLHRPYNGELGPQSYGRWQAEAYYLCRSIAEELIDSFLLMYFPSARKPLPKPKTETFSDVAIQLVAEEYILQMSRTICESTAHDWIHMNRYVQNQTNMYFMQLAEIIATKITGGRDENDPGYSYITKGFLSLKKDRTRTKARIYRHSQILHSEQTDKHSHGRDNGPEDIVEAEIPDEAVHLTFAAIIPTDLRQYKVIQSDDNFKKLNKLTYQVYDKVSTAYWKQMVVNVHTEVISKRCGGVTKAVMSPNNKLIAIGTAHGDLLVYDLSVMPIRLLKVVVNLQAQSDAINDISWSLDSQKLITVNIAGGTVRGWQWIGAPVIMDDFKLIKKKNQAPSVLPTQLTNVFELDVDRKEFRCQSGPLINLTPADVVAAPTIACFYPTISAFGHQSSFLVGLDTGDVFKCDAEEEYREISVIKPDNALIDYEFVESLKLTHPKIDPPGGQASYLGQGIPFEIFRKHQWPIILMTTAPLTQDIITVDEKAFINIWNYQIEELTGYGYYQPSHHYVVEDHKLVFEPVQGEINNVIFTDRKPTTSKKKDIEALRKEAEMKLEKLQLTYVYHQKEVVETNLVTTIYKTADNIGGLFHVVIREIGSGKLSTYLTKTFQPKKVRASLFIDVKVTPDHKELIFMYLFPDFPPKEAHLTVCRLDVSNLSILDWRLDIPIGDEYEKIMQADCVSFDVTKVFGQTGSHYVFINLAGTLSGYGLLTGSKVFHLDTSGVKLTGVFRGLEVSSSALQVTPYSKVICGGYEDRMIITLHSSYVDDAKDHSTRRIQAPPIVHDNIHFIVIKDGNIERRRVDMYNTFKAWTGHPAIPVVESRVDSCSTYLDEIVHPYVYAKNLVMDVIDCLLQDVHGDYPDETIIALGKQDDFRHYQDLARHLGYEVPNIDPVAEKAPTTPRDASDDYDL